jgi:hypothetical protein
MKPIQSLSVVAPGFFGLNTQDSGITLSSNYALVADNCVIDKFGRIGSRKGLVTQTVDGDITLSGTSVKFMMEHVNADNTVVTISGGNNKLLKDGDAGNTFTDITPALYSITNDYWKGASLYDHALIVQEGHEPIVYTESASPTTQTITDYTGVAQNYGTDFPRDVLAAYGRFWVHDGSNIYWSTDIVDVTFPAFNGGTSGFLNISSVLPNNVDTIVGLASHNGFLIIFCEKNIVVYKGAENPLGDFSLSDIIAGVGCVARDSIQQTGADLLFLSDTGVRSLGRVLQEKSMPMRDLTKNIRDDLSALLQIAFAADPQMKQVKSVYSEVNAFYLISFPTSNIVYCLDTRQPMEDGSHRVTRWVDFHATSFLRKRNRDLFIGYTNSINKYSGYLDNTNTYQMRFLSPYMDMQDSTQVKILKKVTATVIGGNNQAFIIKCGFDYEDSYDSYPFVIGSGITAQYNIDEYNIAEYSKGSLIDKVDASVGGAGNVIQLGFETEVNNTSFSVQKLDIFMKTGRKI